MNIFKKIWTGVKVAAKILAGLNRADVIDVNEADKIEKGIDLIDAEIKK